jgi:hypothetical protein
MAPHEDGLKMRHVLNLLRGKQTIVDPDRAASRYDDVTVDG